MKLKNNTLRGGPMKKRKHIFCLFMTMSIILNIAACGTNFTDTEKNSGTEEDRLAQMEWKEDETLKILAIGNSFSDDTMQYVYQIAQSAGVENIVLGNMFIGGCTIDQHANNAVLDRGVYEYRTNTDGFWYTELNYKLSDALSSENWDYVTIQQASGSSGNPDTYGRLHILIEHIRSHVPETTKIAWNMTWAYQQDSTHPEFPYYNNDQMTMYDCITDAVQEIILPNAEISLVIPTGTAIQNARTSYIGDTLTRDGYHLSFDYGRYVAGMALVHALTGLPVDDVTYVPPLSVDDTMRLIAIESAKHAVDSPFKVTDSTYETAPVSK